jgi:hypothetical protein
MLLAGGAALATTTTGVVTILAWLASLAGAGVAQSCVPLTTNTAVAAEYRPLFSAAAARQRLGARGPAILAGIASVESDFGRNPGPSSAGAIGFMQFMPATWKTYGVDADGDGTADPYNPADAIFAAAGYLHASGAPRDWHAALFAYNHSNSYVATVLARAERFTGGGQEASACVAQLTPPAGGAAHTRRVSGGGALVGVPGFPGMRVDERILPDVLYLVRTYRLQITAAYALTGHAPGGEHPLGLALDLIPGPGGDWDTVDRLAHWAEPEQDHPRPPFRWVGYDGDANHGRGNHLHLSWNHAPTPPGARPPAWVQIFE